MCNIWTFTVKNISQQLLCHLNSCTPAKPVSHNLQKTLNFSSLLRCKFSRRKIKHLVVSLPGKICVACSFFSFKYSKSRQTGSGHAADSKLRYTIQFSILMLCAKYHEAGLCGSRENCDRNFL